MQRCVGRHDGFTLKRYAKIEHPNRLDKRDTRKRPVRRPTTRGPTQPGQPKPTRLTPSNADLARDVRAAHERDEAKAVMRFALNRDWPVNL